MTFERTPAGRQNRAKFLGVDAVVYGEGGSHDDNFSESFDILFWRRVFETFNPGKSFGFLPKGGKPHLLSIAENVVKDNIETEYVAIDSDYDDLRGQKIM